LKTAPIFALLAAAAALVPACRPASEEARLRAFLKETVALAEKRDLAGVMARVAEDYSDFEGRDKAATEALVRDYFRRTGIVIHLLGIRVERAGADGQAAVEAEALLSSGAAEVFRKLIRLAGECYRFEVRLARAPDSRWRIIWARWEAVPLSELFPESLALLKKLFPEF
jgi:hypothetical protein